jgi:hypothetical protein
VAKLDTAPVSKTGDCRFESCLPRSQVSPASSRCEEGSEGMSQDDQDSKPNEWLPGGEPADQGDEPAEVEQASTQPSQWLPAVDESVPEPADDDEQDLTPQDPEPDTWVPAENEHGEDMPVVVEPVAEGPSPVEPAPEPAVESERVQAPPTLDIERLQVELEMAEERINRAEKRTREAESTLRDLTTE